MTTATGSRVLGLSCQIGKSVGIWPASGDSKCSLGAVSDHLKGRSSVREYGLMVLDFEFSSVNLLRPLKS